MTVETQAQGAVPARTVRLVILVLALANFIIGIGAFLVIGAMVPIIEDFGVSAARGGWIMTSYAISYAIMSPIIVALTGSAGRRKVLSLGLLLFTLSCVVAALAPNDIVLNAARVLAAAGAGIVTPVAAAVAAGISRPEAQGKALSAVFLGFTLAQVVGVPAGSFLAYSLGWRAAFWIVGGLAFPVMLGVWTLIPAGLSFRAVRLGDLGRVLANPRHMFAVLFTFSFVGATYVVFTFLTPLLSETMGFGRNQMTVVLLVYGSGAVAGNLLGGGLTDRIGPFRTLLILAVSQVIWNACLSQLPMPVWTVFVLVFLWSSFGWSFFVAQQTRLLRLAPERAPVMMAINAAALYAGVAAGSAVGGAVLSTWGLLALGYGGALVALWSAVHLVLSERMARQDAA
ncbi:MFS transporter [Rhodalgimonas zhirmunskyi]|uniref:MFS transporter n=1 Tax=Rhodalgimonas zhirmunskyi TaxID=2964767 RepID=A0AAJ1UC44_9RHOB|nr:MFS transporter [Rhodoalgimonas zhirmunskyi]MDQ2095790.1 MFS transporter [Rhodoalgimonas zhirmunskyi]